MIVYAIVIERISARKYFMWLRLQLKIKLTAMDTVNFTDTGWEFYVLRVVLAIIKSVG
jgi:hypothetical protein